ncbi:MAG: OPT family oligopeptide transporter [Culicoidibacterales bacterium]
MSEKKLPHGAYGGIQGESYVPLLNAKSRQGETSTAVIIVGIFLAVVFAGANAYLGLMSGMTVAAGIPGAILGAGLLLLMNKKSFAGTNTIQAMASGGESVASGIIFVLPAIMLMGAQVDFITGVIIGLVGVALGSGFTVFIRKYLVIQSHGELIFPESMAVSETILTANAGGFGLRVMALGGAIGSAAIILSNQALGLFRGDFLFNEKLTSKFTGNTKYRIDGEINPALIGVGFIVGKDVGLVMMAGAILSNLILIPLIGMFAGYANPATIVFPATIPLVEMGSNDMFKYMIKYVGAGTIAAGGIISVIKLLPVMVASIKDVLGAKKEAENDDKDMSPLLAISAVIGTFVVGVALSIFMGVSIMYAFVAGFLAIVMSILFTVVAARLTGQIGTSNLPVSGMTIASLLVIATVLSMLMNQAGVDKKVISVFVLLFLTIIVTSISMAGGFAQSIKTSFIIGGTTKKVEQLYTLGGIVGVLVVIPIIMLLQPKIMSGEAAAPQANLMNMLTTGIVTGQLPWLFIFIGVAIAIMLYFMKLPIMSFAIGMYLPMSVSLCVLTGGIIRHFVERRNKSDEQAKEAYIGKGIILSSGMIAGASITGLIFAVVGLFFKLPLMEIMNFSPAMTAVISIILYVAFCVIVYYGIVSGKSGDDNASTI